MAADVDKKEVIGQLRARLRERLSALTAAQRAAQSGAVHEETRQEDPKDTRAIEATYLARGLAERVETLRNDIAAVGSMEPRVFAPDDSVALGALLGLEEADGDEVVYFLAPCGGGERLAVDGVAVQVLTPTSPLGSVLIEKGAGEEVDVSLPARRLQATIAWIA